MESRWLRGVFLLAMTVGSLTQAIPAVGGAEEHPAPFRYRWKPQGGWVETMQIEDCWEEWYCRHIAEFFVWDDWPALERLDAPRTPTQDGTYEHEVRFFGSPGYENTRWCDGGDGYHEATANVRVDLPQGSYFDVYDIEQGEFTFGVWSWRVVEDYFYLVDFDCGPTHNAGWAPLESGGDYNVSGQIGHCHHWPPGCGPWNVFADETARHVPRFKGDAPSLDVFWGSFDSNHSLDSPPGGDSPYVADGVVSRICDPYAYHGPCFWRLSSPGSNPRLIYNVFPQPASGGVGSTYAEWLVRCPASQNATSCPVRLVFYGLNDAGTITTSQASPYFSPWYSLGVSVWTHYRLEPPPFPPSTVQWRFVVQTQPGWKLDVDYHQLWYSDE